MTGPGGSSAPDLGRPRFSPCCFCRGGTCGSAGSSTLETTERITARDHDPVIAEDRFV